MFRIALADRQAVPDPDRAAAMTQAGWYCHYFDEATVLHRTLRRNTFDAMVLHAESPVRPYLRRLRGICPHTLFVVIGDPTLEADVISALEHADAFVSEKAPVQELIARVRSLIRRARGLLDLDVVQVGTVTVDARRGWAEVDGRPVSLGKAELALAYTLLLNAGIAVSRSHLHELGAHAPVPGTDRSLDVRLSVLRKKLGWQPEHGFLLRAIRNFGYVLTVLDPAAQLQARQGPVAAAGVQPARPARRAPAPVANLPAPERHLAAQTPGA